MIQGIYQFSDGSGIKLTIGKYLTPLKRDINQKVCFGFREAESAGSCAMFVSTRESHIWVGGLVAGDRVCTVPKGLHWLENRQQTDHNISLLHLPQYTPQKAQRAVRIVWRKISDHRCRQSFA